MRRPTESRLRSTFAEVLTAILATAAATTACGGSTDDSIGGGGGGPTPTYTSLCTSPNNAALGYGLSASPPLDGVVYRTESAFPAAPSPTADVPQEPGDQWTGTNGPESQGTLCKTASNPDACLAEVQGFRFLPADRDACIAKYPLSSYQSTRLACGASYYLYTRGDEIGVAQSVDEIKALIGTVDTLNEALYIAGTAGWVTNCSSKTVPLSEYRTTRDGGWSMSLVKADACRIVKSAADIYVDYAGNLSVISEADFDEQNTCATGRRPAGLRLARAGKGVGEHFASMARLEAASVVAFRRLHRQLAAFDAPAPLLARIKKAVRDEVRHARATGALARKYGVEPGKPEIAADEASPSLFEIARENAREGCVRETFGALVAHLQAERAGDLDVRKVMAAIAEEETDHAALSWDIAGWIESQLSSEQRAELARERRHAFDALAIEIRTSQACLVETTGLPNGDEATRMLVGLAPWMLAA